MTNRIVLAALGVCLVTTAQADKERRRPLTILTVCEVLSHPLLYDGQLVRVRGRVNGSDEGAWLVGDECPGVFVTNEQHVWPSTIFLATPSSTSSGRTRLHSIDFELDPVSERIADSKYRQLRTHIPDKCIAWTYIGLFETRRDWAEAQVVYPNGTTKIIGFGHLGAAPSQIILKSVDDVTAMRNCSEK